MSRVAIVSAKRTPKRIFGGRLKNITAATRGGELLKKKL